MLGGDLNNIIAANESHGTSTYPRHLIRGFCQALVDCNLVDLGYVGSKWTWRCDKKRSRLDRVCADRSWIDLFPNSQVRVLANVSSDHSPLTLNLSTLVGRKAQKRKVFKFEFWLQNEGCEEVVLSSWNILGSDAIIKDKLAKCAESLTKWNAENIGNLHRKLMQTQEKFDHIRAQPPSDYLDQQEDEIFRELNALLPMIEAFWRQLTHINYLAL